MCALWFEISERRLDRVCRSATRWVRWPGAAPIATTRINWKPVCVRGRRSSVLKAWALPIGDFGLRGLSALVLEGSCIEADRSSRNLHTHAMVCSELGVGASSLAFDPGCASVVVAVPGEGVVLDESTSAMLGMAGMAIMEHPDSTPSGTLGRSVLSGVEMFDPAVLEAVIGFVVDKLGGPGERLAVVVPVGMSASARASAKATARRASGAGEVEVETVAAPLAAALTLDLAQRSGAFVMVEMGASSTQAILFASGSGCLADRVVQVADRSVGSRDLDRVIQSWLASQHGLSISDTAAAHVKEVAGSPWPSRDCWFEVTGRSIPGHRHATAVLAPGELRHAMTLTVNQMLRVVDGALGSGGDPVAEVDAIYLSGGGARLRGLAERVAHAPGVPTVVVEDPETAAARGGTTLLEERAKWPSGHLGAPGFTAPTESTDQGPSGRTGR